MLTIAAGLFVLGFFLVVNANLQRVMARWSEAAELSVYLHDDVDAGAAAGDRRRRSSRAACRAPGSTCRRRTRAARFRQDFPDLGGDRRSASTAIRSRPRSTCA